MKVSLLNLEMWHWMFNSCWHCKGMQCRALGTLPKRSSQLFSQISCGLSVTVLLQHPLLPRNPNLASLQWVVPIRRDDDSSGTLHSQNESSLNWLQQSSLFNEPNAVTGLHSSLQKNYIPWSEWGIPGFFYSKSNSCLYCKSFLKQNRAKMSFLQENFVQAQILEIRSSPSTAVLGQFHSVSNNSPRQ